MSEFKKRLSFLFFVLLALGSSFHLAKQTSDFVNEGKNARNIIIKRRFYYIYKNFSDLFADTNRKIYFFGTSPTHYFLNPIHFDRDLKAKGIDRTSYNLGFAGIMGQGTLAFVDRIGEELKSRQQTIDTAYFEFTPLSYSSAFYSVNAENYDVLVPAIFYSSQSWSSLFQSSPIEALKVAFYQNVRPVDFRTVDVVADILNLNDFDPYNRKWIGMPSLWNRPEFIEHPAWRADLRGAYSWNFPASKSLFDKALATLAEPEEWQNTINMTARSNGVKPGYRLKSEMLDMFIASVIEAKKFAKNVVIVKYPLSPTFEKRYNIFINQTELLDQIQKRTGARVIDLTNRLPVSDLDFADPIHPRHETMDQYLNILAEDYSINLSP